MNRTQAKVKLRTLLDFYGFNDWKIHLDTNSDGFLGYCSYKDKTIIINGHHIDTHPDSEVVDTFFHEIAHIYTPGHSHDDVWKDKARELGCTNLSECGMSLSPEAIDAIRSGKHVEVELVDHHEVVTTKKPVYRITTLHDRCVECGKVAKELFSFESDGFKFITLECFHIVKKEIPKENDYSKFLSADADLTCNHEWDATKCTKCSAKKLYPFQVEGAKAIEKANGKFALFDDMGLGKTVQPFAYFKFHPEAFPVLFIVKSGLRFQFFKALLEWLGPEYLAQVINTSNDYVLPGLKCYIASYDIFVSKVRTNKNGKVIGQGFDSSKFKDIGIQTIVLDECQQIKNPDSGRTQEIRKIAEFVPRVIPTSGTPWKNKGSEFFVALNLLDSTKFHSYARFCDQWVNYYYDGNKLKEGGIKNIPLFREYIKDIAIRRERAEVMPELPKVNRTRYWVEIDETAQNSYDEEAKRLFNIWAEAAVGGTEHTFETQRKLNSSLMRMKHIIGLAKVPNTVELVTDFFEQNDRKLALFVHHIDVGLLMVNKLNSLLDIPIFKITSDMNGAERFKVQEEFNKTPKCLLIASMLAAGEGLNLQTCSDMIAHERQWNPANEEQVEGRFARIGQEAESINAIYVLADKGIDKHLDRIVETKRHEFHRSMNKGEMPVWDESNTKKDLMMAIINDIKQKKAS